MRTTVGLNVGPLSFYRPMSSNRPGPIMQLIMLPIYLFIWTIQLTLFTIAFVIGAIVLGTFKLVNWGIGWWQRRDNRK